VHDLTAARIWGILRELAASGLIVLADKGYAGAGDHVRIPYRGRGKPGQGHPRPSGPRDPRMKKAQYIHECVSDFLMALPGVMRQFPAYE
jgi:hypothetical protein